MVVMILEKVTASLRGELSKWLMEPVRGVFLGRISAAVREILWEKCVSKVKSGGCMMIYSWPTEQGFMIRCSGNLSRNIIDVEGLFLARKSYKVPF